MDFEEEYADIETSWIDDFENIDALYNDFYTEQLDSLSIHYLYVNKKSELFHIEKDIIDIYGISANKVEVIYLGSSLNLKMNLIQNPTEKTTVLSILIQVWEKGCCVIVASLGSTW